jgi:IPT/TIG domain-containing protein
MLNLRYFAIASTGALLTAALLTAVTPVVITSTNISSSKVLTVTGSGFATGGTPTVIFDGHTARVNGFTNTSVTATLPSGTSQGDYQVTIRNSQGHTATATSTYDVDPALVTNGTLKGNGTRTSPLRVAVPLTLNSSSETTPTLILTNNSVNYTPALDVPVGWVHLDEGGIQVFNLGQDGGNSQASDGATGVVGAGATGVYGLACCASSPTDGVVGDSAGQPGVSGIHGIGGSAQDEYAGLFEGNVDVTGKLTKGGGCFKIDHPLDPANKYLYHSFVESPDMMTSITVT